MTHPDRLVRIRIDQAAARIAAARQTRAGLDDARGHGLDARRRRKLTRAWCPTCYSVSARGPASIVHKPGCADQPNGTDPRPAATHPHQPNVESETT